MNKHILTSLFSLLWANLLFAQIDPDALGYYDYAMRYTQENSGFSPRMQALGGAQTSLGADYSQQAQNPAGLGLYQKSDIGITFGNDFNQFEQNINYNTTDINKHQFNIQSMGIVIGSTDFNKVWKNHNIGFSYNRLGSILNPIKYSRHNQSNSLRNFLVNTAQGTNFSIFRDQLDKNGKVEDIWGLAYYTFLLNTKNETSKPDEYFTFNPHTPDIVNEKINHKHRNMQYNMSYGNGIDDKFYWGISLGIRSVYESKKRCYTEAPDATLKSFTLEETEATQGLGANFTVGIIIKPIDALRIGFSYKTSTAMELSENYKASISAEYDNYTLPNNEILTKEKFETIDFITNYTLKIPSLTSLGISYFFKDKGFITADAKFSPVKKARLKSTSIDFEADNITIKNLYRNQITANIGGELRFGKSFVRAGTGLQNSPYKFYRTVYPHYSFGLGQQLGDGTYVDISFEHRKLLFNQYRPYSGASTVNTIGLRNNISISIHQIIL